MFDRVVVNWPHTAASPPHTGAARLAWEGIQVGEKANSTRSWVISNGSGVSCATVQTVTGSRLGDLVHQRLHIA